ncbi:MAG: cobalamin biosynthesis protein CobD [Candidatus Aramenus sulfurataquae]|uniref:Cobalamin biosynthesis protein n=2 Tax=Candidatus Aramenus sulfurataquae TaxID=1326980 RepID=A0ACC6TLF5_9CREN|nr:MAG: cobalamin biosynthesis protein CobD [Candidatus Aramenus sulfurataquae]MCL7343198.1 cobalamin biosynthesis protein [Candidatus Aramenus sulfurataquae]
MLLVLLASLVWDLALGEPPTLVHPVVITGKISERLIKPNRGYVYGVFLWFASVLPVLIPASLVPLVPFSPLKFLILAFVLKTTFSIKMLYDIVSRSVNLDESSRYLVQQIVRRDLSREDKGHIASAAIESLFESFVDGISSPLFWFLLLGVPGAMLQRLANTMDSMVGYKTPDLKREGFFSAKVDTLLNYVPARISALIILFSALILRYNVRGFRRILRESGIESVNARYPISAAATALGVKLEKRGYYTVGTGELPGEREMKKALKLFKLSLALYLLLLLVVYYCLYGLSLLGFPYGLLKFL